MRVIVVGASEVTRAALARIGERWDVVVIDPDPDHVARMADIRPVTPVIGDGSSRVVLERAGLAEADALIAGTGDDDVTVEVCRLALAADVDRVVAIVDDPERSAALRKLGVVPISPARLAARDVEINLEPRRVASAAFANGRAEAVEFRISPDSPLRGRMLRDLGETPWLVAAILRNDQLIVPHGTTELRANDLVTVVGAAADYSTMVATFTGGVAHFPLHRGRKAAVWIGSGGDAETIVMDAVAFTRETAAEGLLVVHDDPTALGDERSAQLDAMLERLGQMADGIEPQVGSPGLSGLLELAETESIGVVIAPKPRGRIRTVRTLQALSRARMPAFLTAGTRPFTGIVTPARDSIGGWRAAWTAIDLAARSGLPLEGLGVVPPSFVAGDSDIADVRRAVARIRGEASVQGVHVDGRVETGNPVRVFGAIEPDRLVVLGLGGGARNLLMPGLTGHIVSRIGTSVVVVPDQDRS